MKRFHSTFKIADLIVKGLNGKLTKEEEVILNEWKFDSPENLALFHKLSKNPETNFFRNEETVNGLNKNQIWYQVNARIKQKKIKKNRIGFLKYAACLVVIGSSIFGLINLMSRTQTNEIAHITPGKKQALLIRETGETLILEEFIKLKEDGVEVNNKDGHLVYKSGNSTSSIQKVSVNSIITPKGGEYNLTLSDGTRIWLNSDSKLKYPTRFTGKQRIVELEGEAYFDVSKDMNSPFIVKINDIHIKVLGTSFNVNAYSDANEVVTTLVEGKVEVADILREQKETLLPKDQYSINIHNGNYKKTIVDTDIFTAWKRGRFVFDNEKLEDIMLRLSRWYNVEVFFQNEESRSIRFSGDLARYETFESILEMIEMTEKVKFKIKGKHVLINK